MAQPFQTVHVDDQNINRIQANISNTLNSLGQVPEVTSVNKNPYSVKSTDTNLVFDTTQISGVTATAPLVFILPDATKLNGFSFSWHKLDTTSNLVSFTVSATNKQNQNQTIAGAASPFQDSNSLGKGAFFSDGNNWWVL